jgi:hypothetical protein
MIPNRNDSDTGAALHAGELMNNNRTLYIIRGLPGTGKTTLAHQLTPWVCEADMFFTSITTGEYRFDTAKLGEAHAYCQGMVEAYMKHEFDKIAVSNTFSQRWEFAKYVMLAQLNQYNIVEITMTGDTYGSIHNVPEETVEKMKARWES